MQDVREFFAKHTYSQLVILAKGMGLIHKRSAPKQKEDDKPDFSKEMNLDEYMDAINKQGGVNF